ncbi:MAG: helix-turn-helix transcriptional regulator [Deltaproteobacteria bacterium]|nr:helix-turn-helix transcriptional regulator [Deltaproteobacteria bacterium]
MSGLGVKQLQDILRINELAHCLPDRSLLGREVLNAVCGALGVEKCIFILQEEGAAAPDFFVRGIDPIDVERYRAYFHAQDPLGLMSFEADRLVVAKATRERPTVSLQELVPRREFVSTEYYKEFYRPQGLFYEIVTYLELPSKVRGVIDLLRTEHDRAFTAGEMQLMDALAPYIARAVQTFRTRRELEAKESAITIYEDRAQEGLLLCDASMRIVYASRKAKDFCEAVTGQPLPSTLPQAFQDELGPAEESVRGGRVVPLLPRERSFVVGARRYQLRYELTETADGARTQPLLSISISRCEHSRAAYEAALKQQFHLTCREIEIVGKIFDGLTNAEIGDELFISEFTVKKHLQNICEKLKVRSRTGIISAVLRACEDVRAPVASLAT